MTISDLLNNSYYRGNKTVLARELNVSRNTLRKYAEDKDGMTHIIRKQYGEYVLFGLLSKGEKNV